MSANKRKVPSPPETAATVSEPEPAARRAPTTVPSPVTVNDYFAFSPLFPSIFRDVWPPSLVSFLPIPQRSSLPLLRRSRFHALLRYSASHTPTTAWYSKISTLSRFQMPVNLMSLMSTSSLAPARRLFSGLTSSTQRSSRGKPKQYAVLQWIKYFWRRSQYPHVLPRIGVPPSKPHLLHQ